MKTYGEKDYKGFILLENKKTKSLSKHYISAVDQDHFDNKRVNIYYRTKNGDGCINYKPGTNAKVDKGVKTWICNRRNKKMKTSNYSNSVFSKLFNTK